MSEPVVVVCMDCGAVMPPIGDYGFVGYPSLIEQPFPPNSSAWDWGVSHSFGCLRKTLAEIGISTDELEQVAEFLKQHQGHRFGINCDGQLQDEVEGIDDGQAIIDEVEENGYPNPLAYTPKAERGRSPYVLGHYSLICKCGATYETPNPEVVRPLPDVLWTPRLIELLKTTILDIDNFNFWRVTSELIDPGDASDQPPPPLREIAAFVTEHVGHGVTGCIRIAG